MNRLFDKLVRDSRLVILCPVDRLGLIKRPLHILGQLARCDADSRLARIEVDEGIGNLVGVVLLEQVLGTDDLFARDRVLHPASELDTVRVRFVLFGKAERNVGHGLDLVECDLVWRLSAEEGDVLEDGKSNVFPVFCIVSLSLIPEELGCSTHAIPLAINRQ